MIGPQIEAFKREKNMGFDRISPFRHGSPFSGGLAVLFLFACSIASGDWIPPDRAVTAKPALLRRDEIRIDIPGAGSVRPAEFRRAKSLAGMWKFSGLESSGEPFPSAPGEAEAAFVGEAFDDSGWPELKVPLNWWASDKYSYEKVLRFGSKTVDKGGGDYRLTDNPYFKGWYRRSVELPDPLPPGRILLEFDAIGYEARLYVNGKPAGRHHGDFVPFSADITGLVKPGKNTVALRVLADMGPRNRSYTRTYGAMWSTYCVKGGIWQNVRLVVETSPRIDSLRISTDPAAGTLRLDYDIVSFDPKPLTLTPGIAVVSAAPGDAGKWSGEFPPVTLKEGRNSGTLTLKCDSPRLWSPESPNLYFATLYFREGKKVATARIERFGFRALTVDGTRFRLNGRPIYLFSESIPSFIYGGWNTPGGNLGNRDPRDHLVSFRKKGYNIVRTPHMPITTETLEAADETGMMIYDEWSYCFLPRIDEIPFEANNLAELEKFVRRDYNHPSVVMWSLGNEVEHRVDPAMTRQLNKQVALVRRLDFQKRPVSAFAGVGNVGNYGKAKLDTDVIDYHLYVGITKPWTRWIADFDSLNAEAAKIYGDGKTMSLPVFISECVGGGWGLKPDPAYHHGESIDRYVEIMEQPYSFGNPGPRGYSGVIGIAAALDPRRSWQFTHNYLGTRLVELIRQDPRVAGFAPWISYATAQGTRWTQPVYPGLRNNAKEKMMPRQFLVPGSRELEAFVLNQAGPDLADARLRVELAEGRNLQPIAELDFGPLAAGKEAVKRFAFALPAVAAGTGEVRLTLFDGGKEIGRNSYPVTLHPVSDATAPAAGADAVALLVPDPALEMVLKELGIPYRTVRDPEGFRCALIPPRVSPAAIDAAKVRGWADRGGRLLVLEQSPGSLPGIPEYQVTSDYNTFVEIAVPGHPVFAGLGQADFDIWAENPDANLLTGTILPLNATALAVKGSFLDSKNCGAALAEAKTGKGRILLSQFDALRLWRKNGGATRYLRNLLVYLAKPEKLWDARPLEGNQRFSFTIRPDRTMTVDLRKFATHGFADETAGDGRGGWTDQGDNDFRQLPVGRREGAGIPFDIIDPAGNDGKSCIALRSEHTPSNPSKVCGIPVNAKVNALYFLHTLGYGGTPAPAGKYRIHYADGTQADFDIRSGLNAGDWWSPSRLPEALPCFIVTNRLGYPIGLYAARWENPRPDCEVKSFDFLSIPGTGAIPILVAVTAEKAHEHPLTLLSASQPDPHVAVTSENGGPRGSFRRMPTMDAKIGAYCSRIQFPATEGNSVPAAVVFLFFDRNRLAADQFDSLAFDLRSSDSGRVEVVIPQKDHRSRLIHSFELQRSGGKWVRVRLDLAKDFRLEGRPFELRDMRPEIIFYNGKDRSAGFPRRAVTFDITNLRLE